MTLAVKILIDVTPVFAIVGSAVLARLPTIKDRERVGFVAGERVAEVALHAEIAHAVASPMKVLQ